MARLCGIVKSELTRSFSTSCIHQELQLLSRMRVVDNSAIGQEAELAGKPAKIIHVYNKTRIGKLGDKVLVAIMGQKKKGYIVGCKQKQKVSVPRFDSNNLVLVDDTGAPLGTRIKVPIPSCLRGTNRNRVEFTKMLAIATRFV